MEAADKDTMTMQAQKQSVKAVIEHFLNGLNDSTSRPMLQVHLNGKKIVMEVDTSATVIKCCPNQKAQGLNKTKYKKA